jgi:hypothetical protein
MSTNETNEPQKYDYPAVVYLKTFKDSKVDIDKDVFISILENIAKHEEFLVQMTWIDAKIDGYKTGSYEYMDKKFNLVDPSNLLKPSETK